MGAKKTSGKRKNGDRKNKGPGQGQRTGSTFAGASFERSQVLGSGTQTTKINVQAYAAVPTALNALPGLPQEFTGRGDEITKILSLLGPGGGADAAVGSIAGLPGVGKTTLAHAVGRAALDQGWFMRVQVVNLRGYDPTPVPPEDALEALLRALGVAAEHIPPTLDEREGLYRSQLEALAVEGQRVLILLDNASASNQVRPLLPARHHAVLVTSRHALPGLGARLFNLNPLQPDAAVDLLRQRLKVADPDDRRVEDEPSAAEELAAVCGYLPLALQIAAALLADDPDQPLYERVRMLTNAGTRLGGLDDGERNLRAVFDECLTRLSHQEADFYRLLGLHPGPDISTPAAAALTGQSADKVTQLLRQLVRARLLTQNSQARDRWSMHDLLRVHAQEQARIAMDRDRVPRRRYEQARARLTDYYVRHARAANNHFRPPGEAASTLFAGREQALAWFDAERENLLATTHTYARTQTAVDLGFTLGRYLEWRRRIQDLMTVRAQALEACQALGDDANLAGAWNNLGSPLGELRRHTEAHDAHQTALDLYRQTGDIDGQASAWNNVGSSLRELKRHTEALDAHQAALDLFQQTGDTHGQAGAWSNLGVALAELKRHTEAHDAHQAALDLFQQTGDTHGQAIVWNNLGSSLRELKRRTEAHDAHLTALDLFQQTGDTHGQARAWSNLGGALAELKRRTEAHDAHLTALDLYQQTGDTHGQAMAWDNLGLALAELKRYTQAHDAHKTALDLYQQTGDTHGQASAWDNLGLALRELKRYAQAHDAHQTALDLYQQTSDIDGQASAWSNLGLALAELKRHTEAHDAHQTALDLFQQTGDTHGQAIAWNNLGVACRSLEQYPEATAAGEKAVAMLTQAEDWTRTGEAWAEYATTLHVSGAELPRVRDAWEQSATAYIRAGDDEEAATSRANAETQPPLP
ncbi:tetratricopeptide repeat protein [Streptomyces doebereineriae]|uniref:Tetratricopeptide repeat protein n=1 Tax=Streptomyces doebereineriae TaxID=3075528 RepID=A0ABU2VJN8_9ACTN|nr:tetratricopeptide repeat protein [Streptomyces sp. DSM 41640]MDT0485485.1 tetratricopeptide repeat protein [Streptomyces sp. DSM 41640]